MSNTKVTTRERRKNKIKAKILSNSPKTKLLVFRSNTTNYAQLIDPATGKTIAAVADGQKATGTKSEKAKQVGIEIAKKALENNIKEVVFDRNGYKYHGRVKAIAEGAREGGLKF
ncbi:50S ribosomal protein L18 [Candidatus Peregrinibacteria bacterium HGW-Peregrinibacteria-1]|jgi:large subunit ribosomal protein L18|nr:ribosomal protein L18 [uncultured bacterium]PKL36317.1 MAG: 50S ribosomal protein L18 [Candidatus Peregrinibacteria bacterium HGW-Peregrinibacteria-1]